MVLCYCVFFLAACTCDPSFSNGLCEEGTGRCQCRPEYAGDNCDRLALSYCIPCLPEQSFYGSQSGLRSGSQSGRCTHLQGTFIVQYNKMHHIFVHC